MSVYVPGSGGTQTNRHGVAAYGEGTVPSSASAHDRPSSALTSTRLIVPVPAHAVPATSTGPSGSFDSSDGRPITPRTPGPGSPAPEGRSPGTFPCSHRYL